MYSPRIIRAGFRKGSVGPASGSVHKVWIGWGEPLSAWACVPEHEPTCFFLHPSPYCMPRGLG